jgi:hypothetical protein
MQGVRSVSKPKSSPKPKPPPNFKHGAYSLLAIRTKEDRPDPETELGEAFRAAEDEYLKDLGGVENVSRAMRNLVNDSVWCDLLIATMDFQLEDRRQLIRKSRPHPIIELRMRVATHRRENYRVIGLERRSKQLTWDDFKPTLKKGDDDETENANGETD